MPEGNIAQDNLLDFMFGGNALFTVKSNKTGKRFTFKVLKNKVGDWYRVMIMNGTDNTKDYKLIGEICHGYPGLKLHDSRYATLESCIAFDHIYLNLLAKRSMPIEIWHEGRCCRCGRVLTVPESIAMGIGPECAFK